MPLVPQQIKMLLAKLIGTADQTVEARFSEEALDKAAKEFLKMSIERCEWFKDEDVPKYIKGHHGGPANLSGENLHSPTCSSAAANTCTQKKT